MKLTSMVDFVLEQRNLHKGDIEDFVDLICRYALFLKQHLELWMFVPCYLIDGIWIPYTKGTLLNTMKLFNEWEQAKERCFFEGFRIENGIIFTPENQVLIQKSLLEKMTIENLIGLNHNLTKKVIKEIGL